MVRAPIFSVEVKIYKKKNLDGNLINNEGFFW